MKEIVTNDNRAPAKNIKESFYQSTGLNVSTKTICRNLHQIGFNSNYAASKPLNDKQRQNRLEWCMNRRNWSKKMWRSVIWSDESCFTLFCNDGPMRVWCKAGTRYNIKNLMPTVKHGGGGIMVWGVFFSIGFRTIS